MENNHTAGQIPEEQYVPRPAWQIWAARAGLVLFLLFVAWQVLMLFSGGRL